MGSLLSDFDYGFCFQSCALKENISKLFRVEIKKKQNVVIYFFFVFLNVLLRSNTSFFNSNEN